MPRVPVGGVAPNGLIAILSVALVTFGLAIWGNTFPLGYHYDEPLKVRFAQIGGYDYHHPLLLIRLLQAATLISGITTDQEIAILGRTISAALAVVVVVAVYILGKDRIGHKASVLAALLVGTSPTIVVHAHYLKEDMLLLATGLCGILASQRYVDAPSPRRSALLGVALALVVSAHYKGLLLVATIGLIGLLSDSVRRSLSPTNLAIGVAAMLSTCAVIMPDLVLDPSAVWSGFTFEHQLALQGRAAPIHGFDTGFTYHFFRSLAPGVTMPIAIAGFLAVMAQALRMRTLSFAEQLLIAYGLISYVIVEWSPSKPPPDDARYVLPFVPTLAYCLAASLREWFGVLVRGAMRGHARSLCRVTSITIRNLSVCALVLWPFVDSALLCSNMTRDTREKARQWLIGRGVPVFGAFSSATSTPEAHAHGFEINISQLRAQGHTHFVASSFAYEQFYYAASLVRVTREVSHATQGFDELFQLPYVEFRPAYRSFAFSNPVIRIVDIRQKER